MSLSRSLDLTQEDYAVQDAILQYISSNFVSLKPPDVKFFKRHLENVTKVLIQMMRKEDNLFNMIFQKERVAGSFWDKLKIGHPIEFDKNFVLTLPPALYKNIKFTPASPSYVTVNVQNGLKIVKSSKCRTYRPDWFDDNGNILSDKLRFWMESVVNKALATLPPLPNKKYQLEIEGTCYEIGTRKSGPAVTVEVNIGSSGSTYLGITQFCIDLVPAFEFQTKDWPHHIRQCPADTQDKTWNLVPKPLKPEENTADGNIPARLQWRLSFHNQESYIIHNLNHFKAVLKLLKKLRDEKFDQYKMSSYALKTVFMLEKERQNNDFWRRPLSSTFLHMLTVLTEWYGKGKIPFYWDKQHNLLGKLSKDQIKQVYCTLQKINNRIYEGLQSKCESKCDHFIIASTLLDPEELQKIKKDIIVDRSGNKPLAKRQRCS